MRRCVVRRRRPACAKPCGPSGRPDPRAAGSGWNRPRPSGPGSRGPRPRRAGGRPTPGARGRAPDRRRRVRRRRAGSPRGCRRGRRRRDPRAAASPARPRRWCGPGRAARSAGRPCGRGCAPCGRWPGRGRASSPGSDAPRRPHHQQSPLEQPAHPSIGADELERQVCVTGDVAVADDHGHVGGQTFGAERGSGERGRHREEEHRAARRRREDRAALATGHVHAHHGQVGRSPGGRDGVAQCHRVAGVADQHLVGETGGLEQVGLGLMGYDGERAPGSGTARRRQAQRPGLAGTTDDHDHRVGVPADVPLGQRRAPRTRPSRPGPVASAGPRGASRRCCGRTGSRSRLRAPAR